MCIMCKRERERERERVRRLTYQKDRILLHEKPHSNTFPLNMDNKEREKTYNDVLRMFFNRRI